MKAIRIHNFGPTEEVLKYEHMCRCPNLKPARS
jgi:hypothetical protein